MSSVIPARDDSVGSVARTKPWLPFVISLALATIAASLPPTMLPAVLPLIGEEISASPATMTWLLIGFMVVSSAVLPLSAQIGGRYGKRKVIIGALAVAIVGQVIAGTATGVPQMFIGLALAGVGLAVQPGVYSLIDEHLDERRRGLAVGIVGGSILTALALSNLVTGPIVEHLNYHWVFWITAIALVLSLGCVLLFVEESRIRLPGRIDWLGSAVLAIAVGALLIAFNQGGTWGWGSLKTVALIVVGLILLVAFVPLQKSVEKRGHTPTVSVRILVKPGIIAASLISLFGFAVMYGCALLFSYFVMAPRELVGYGFDFTVSQTNYLLFTNTVVGAVAAYASGYLNRFMHPIWLCMGAGVAQAITALYFIFNHDTEFQIYMTAVGLGISVGLLISPTINVVLQSVSEEDSAPASSMSLLIQSISGAIGLSVCAVFLTNGTDPLTQMPDIGAYENIGWLFLACGVLIILTAVPFIMYLRSRANGADPTSAAEKAPVTA